MSLDEALSNFIRNEVREAVASALALTPAPKCEPIVATTNQLCELLSICPATVHRFRKAGMPHFFLGDSPRFNTAEVRAWIVANPSTGGRGKKSKAAC